MTADPKPVALPELPKAVRMSSDQAFMGYTADQMCAYAEQAIDALRAEVERLRQLVNGGRGPLPAGAVAWLDMSPGEASLAFDKKSDSNRANKRRVMELFHRVSAGYYPLYLEPQADRAERLAEALRGVLPYVEHADHCGDHDAYNNATVPACGCGLDGAREFADALLREQEAGRG